MDLMIFLCKYFLVISDLQVDSFLDELFFLFAVILPELHEKPRGKDWITEKSTRKNLCKEYHFFDCALFIRCLCFLHSPFPINVLVEWPLKRYIVLSWVVFCVMISWVNGQKYENLLQFNTSWLSSLRTWYFFKLCFRFSCSGYDLTLIKKSHAVSYYSLLRNFLLKSKT